ncbi:hypothetical protein Ciccas_009518, partial [Cichlidogyrus casuarinus]
SLFTLVIFLSQCRAPQAPIIIVGTHTDKCPDEDEPQHGKFTVKTLIEMVNRRYFQICLDPTSYGIPSICKHVPICCPSITISASEDAINQTKYLASIIHKAANSMRISGRMTAAFLGQTSGRAHQAMRFLGLPVPLLFHEIETITIELSQQMQRDKIHPIMPLDQYLFVSLQLFNPGKMKLNKIVDFETRRIVKIIFYCSSEVCSRVSQSQPQQQEGRSLLDRLNEARAAVSFLHEVGCVMYLPSPALHNVIFLDPVWLFRFLLRLLVVSPSEEKKTATQGKKSPLRAGVLPISMMVHLLSRDCTPCGFTTQQLTQILVEVLSKYELAVPLNKDHLLVPAMLPLEQRNTEVNIDRRLVDNASEADKEVERQIRVLPNEQDCAVFTLPRKAGTRPPLEIESPEEESVRVAFKRFHPNRQPLKKTSLLASKVLVPDWELVSDMNSELVRIYAMSYVPAGFWTRLITRLLSDSTLDKLCRRFYSLDGLPRVFMDSLLCYENPLQIEHIQGSLTDNSTNASRIEVNELPPGWSVWQTGLHLTLAGGRIKVMSLKQATESCTAALQIAKRQLATANELVFLESDTFTGSRIDYRQRNGRKLEMNPDTNDIHSTTYCKFLLF